MIGRKLLVTFLLLASISLAFFFSGGKLPFVHAQTVTPTPDPSQVTSSIAECANNNISVADCPGYLQNKVNQLQGQADTLSSQIAVMDSQISLTQARIYATEQQISTLTLNINTASQKINDLQSSLSNLTNVLMNRIVATYEVGSIQPMQILLTSGTVGNFLQQLNFLKIAQAHDKQLLYDTVQAKNDYQNQKQIYEDQKKQVEDLKAQLEAYNSQLAAEQQSKKQLLAETQGSESVYQSLLSQAKAQLAGFSGFAQRQGGASILYNQTVCDDWGCYYNQRDAQWGNVSLNSSVGTPYSIASAGCLLTSMAMVYTHYGHRSVTPLSINSNPNNFASYYPAFLNRTIVADGAQSTRVSSYIDPTLASGNPVIVGMQYANGDTHFVVLLSGSNGNYMMNDPFTPNGHNIPFTSHYSMNMIYEVDKVNL